MSWRWLALLDAAATDADAQAPVHDAHGIRAGWPAVWRVRLDQPRDDRRPPRWCDEVGALLGVALDIDVGALLDEPASRGDVVLENGRESTAYG